jgi:alpha-beta hydrolase superfamily lysophospholipase
MSVPARVARVVAITLCAIGPVVGAQAPERAVFLVRQGADTLAVENASRDGTRLEGRLILRSPLLRIGQVVTLTDSSTVERLITLVSPVASGDTVQQRAELTFRGDSAVSHVEDVRAPVPIPDRRLKVTPGAIPFINLSGLSLELILRRARALGGDSARVPVILLGGQTVTATVTTLGGDSLLLTLGGVSLRAYSDGQGRLLGAAVPSQHVVFERLPGDAAAGRWTPAILSYAPPSGAPYTAEEVRVRTPAGLALAGTLTLPPRRAGVRVPAVVLITGSGPQDRDERSDYLPKEYRPFREIADTLSRRGIAVLRLDDRGVGASDIGPLTATSADLADDVRTALAWLRTRPEIDSTRLGLVGHSEGGIIAPMVAATESRVRGIALIAGMASTGRKISEYQIRYLFSRDTTLARAQRDSLLALALRQSDSAYATPGWLRWIGDHDPLPTARRVRVPTLILQGETDRQVPAADAARLAAAMRAAGNRRVTVRTFPRMNHLMLDDPSGDVRGYGSLPGYHVRKDLLGALADWVARTL